MSQNPEKIVMALEKSLLTHEVRHSLTKLDEILHPDFQEIGKSGYHFGKKEVLESLTTEINSANITAENFSTRQLSPILIQVFFTTSSNDQKALRSSLWKYEDNRWQIIFHQGTKAPQA